MAVYFMILKKLIISLSFLCILNGCAQNAALIGPAITGASTGNIYQAGLSYGTGRAIKRVTGKTTIENIKSLMYVKKADIIENESYEEFFDATEILIKKK